MNTLLKLVLVVTLIAGSVSLTAMASAMPFGDGPGCGRAGHYMGAGQHPGNRGPNLERLSEKLNLTDEQRAEIKAIMGGSRQQMGELRDKLQVNRDKLRDLVRQTEFDESVVRRIADEQGDMKAEMIVLRARQRSEMRAVLNDDQLARLDEMRKGKHHRGRSNRF